MATILDLLAKLSMDSSQFSAGVNKAKGDMEKLTGEIGKAGDVGKQKLNFAGTFAEMMLGINQAILLWHELSDAAVKAYQFVREGAELRTVEQRFDRLAKSIGTVGDVLRWDLHEAARGVMNDAELLSMATQLMTLGLAETHDEAVRLTNVATSLGMNMDQLTLTLTNQSIRRFDNIGLSVVGFTKKVKALEAAGLDADKAFKEAFLQQAEKQIERVGHSADSAVGDFLKLEAAFKDLGDTATKSISELSIFKDFISELTSSVSVVNLNRSIKEMEEQLIEFGYTVEEISNLYSGQTWFFFDSAGAEEAAMGYAKVLQDELTPHLMEQAKAQQFASDMAKGYAAQVMWARGETWEYINTTLGLTDSLGDLADATEEAEDAFDAHALAVERAKEAASRFSEVTDIAKNALFELGVEADVTAQMLDDLRAVTDEKTAADLLLEEISLRLTEEWVNQAISAGTYNTAMNAAIDIAERYPEALQPLLTLFGEWGDKVQNISDLLHGIPSEIKVDIIQTWYEAKGGTWGGAVTFGTGDKKDTFGRAGGGPVVAGSPYIVGEEGPELYVPKEDGYIISNDDLRGLGNNYYYTLNMPTSNRPEEVVMGFNLLKSMAET